MTQAYSPITTTSTAPHYPITERFQPTLFELPSLQQPTPDLRLMPSAALSDTRAGYLSPRYGQIRSFEIVAQLVRLGFALTGGRGGGAPHGKHSLYLTHPSVAVEGFGVSDASDLEIGFSIENSHDGSACYRAALALKDRRTGDIIPLAHDWSQVKVRHNVHIVKTAAEATHRLADAAPRVATTLEALEAVTIGDRVRDRLVDYGLRVRWGEKRRPVNVETLLEQLPSGVNLYRIMRALSRLLLDGGLKTQRGSKTRRVRQPNERLRVMREIWAHCESVANGED